MAKRRTPFPRQRFPTFWFSELWDDQNGLCALCQEPMPRVRSDTPHASIWKKRRPTFDHIIPVSKGGSDRLDNLQLAHATCNKAKGNKLQQPLKKPSPA